MCPISQNGMLLWLNHHLSGLAPGLAKLGLGGSKEGGMRQVGLNLLRLK